MADLFDLLDKSIDDLADLPAFKVPDTGVYMLHVTADMKEINKKPAVTFSHKIRGIVELAEDIPEAERAKPDDKFDVAFILKDDNGADNEMGWGRLKEYLKPFEAYYGEKNIKTLLMGPLKDGVDITAKVVKVERKREKGVFDARVSDIIVE